jgi:hypothetical protein
MERVPSVCCLNKKTEGAVHMGDPIAFEAVQLPLRRPAAWKLKLPAHTRVPFGFW